MTILVILAAMVAALLATILWAQRRRIGKLEDEVRSQISVSKFLAEQLMLERTDGSKRAVRVVLDHTRYTPPDVVIAEAVFSIVGNQDRRDFGKEVLEDAGFAFGDWS